MEILNSELIIVFYVDVLEDGEETRYTRHSEDNWTYSVGESDKACYDCEELEKLFKERQRKLTLGN